MSMQVVLKSGEAFFGFYGDAEEVALQRQQTRSILGAVGVSQFESSDLHPGFIRAQVGDANLPEIAAMSGASMLIDLRQSRQIMDTPSL